MSTLNVLLIRLAFPAVLWLSVITAVGVVRTDLPGGGTPRRLLVAVRALGGATHARAGAASP